MILTALDLEFNQPSEKIIQIGTAYMDTYNLTVSKGISIFVDPGEPIDPRIVDLTGITDKIINDQAVSLNEAYDILCKWLLTRDAFINPLTWGGGDSESLRHQLDLDDNRFIYGRRWIDVKTVFITHMINQNKPFQGGLARSMTKLGLQFQGRKHRADDDAFNTCRIYAKLLELNRTKDEKELPKNLHSSTPRNIKGETSPS